MKKFIAVTIVVVGAGIFLSGCTDSENKEMVQLKEIVANNDKAMNVPERTPEINGVISSVNGNTVIVKNEVGKKILTDKEKAEKKAERQRMTQEERQALRAQELAGVETEDVTIKIPAGAVLIKGTGAGDGSSTKATFDDLVQGIYISAWINNSNVEAVKIKGL